LEYNLPVFRYLLEKLHYLADSVPDIAGRLIEGEKDFQHWNSFNIISLSV
jgi:hypothetical protein